MQKEPVVKRTFAFFDGQNLFHSARESFGYTYPNYDPLKLAESVCSINDWRLDQVFFYTGIPSNAKNPHWHHFWSKKLAFMGSRGIKTFTRPLRYQMQKLELSDGTLTSIPVAQEKGIDVRIAIDIVSKARLNMFDVALLFSQDQDLSEAATEIRDISNQQNRWIKIASTYPISPTSINKRGINKTDWIQIDKIMYDSCLDPYNYSKMKI